MAQDSTREESGVKLFRLAYNASMRSDSYPESIPVMDSNNVVLTPDGTSIMPRQGSEIRNRYNPVAPEGRKAILVETNPPDINNGQLLMIVNTSNGLNVVENFELVKTPEDINNDVAGMALIIEFLSNSPVMVTSGNVTVELYRTGNPSQSGSVTIRSTDGTFSPTSPVNMVVDFGAGEFKKTITLSGLGDGEGYFYLDLFNPSRGVQIGLKSRLTLELGEAPPYIGEVFTVGYRKVGTDIYMNVFIEETETFKGVILTPDTPVTNPSGAYTLCRATEDAIVVLQVSSDSDNRVYAYYIEDIKDADNEDVIMPRYSKAIPRNFTSCINKIGGSFGGFYVQGRHESIADRIQMFYFDKDSSASDGWNISNVDASILPHNWGFGGTALLRSNFDSNPLYVRAANTFQTNADRNNGSAKIVKFNPVGDTYQYAKYTASQVIPYNAGTDASGTPETLPAYTANYVLNEWISSDGLDVGITSNMVLIINSLTADLILGYSFNPTTYNYVYPLGWSKGGNYFYCAFLNTDNGTYKLGRVFEDDGSGTFFDVVGGTSSNFAPLNDGTFSEPLQYLTPFDRMALAHSI